MSDIQDNEPKWLPPCSECAECNGRGGRWDEEAIDQWYWCRHCDAAEKEAMSQPVSNADELERLRAEVDRVTAERDEAHGLIRKWKVNLVEVVDDGEIMYAMTNDSMCNMTDSDKRAFLAATAKERGGA